MPTATKTPKPTPFQVFAAERLLEAMRRQGQYEFVIRHLEGGGSACDLYEPIKAMFCDNVSATLRLMNAITRMIDIINLSIQYSVVGHSKNNHGWGQVHNCVSVLEQSAKKFPTYFSADDVERLANFDDLWESLSLWHSGDRTFYQTDAWRKVRYEALVMHGGKCQCCGRAPNDGVVLHVDHIKPRSRYPLLSLSVTNLQVLCEDCNLGKGAEDETDWRPTEAGTTTSA